MREKRLTVELARQLREDLDYCRGGTSGGRDNVECRGPALPDVLFGEAVQEVLGRRAGVHGRQHARVNTERPLQNKRDGREAVGLSRGSASTLAVPMKPGTCRLTVHDALEMMYSSWTLMVWWLTPYTIFGASLLGAEMMTRLAPPNLMCAPAVSRVVILPVDSSTVWTPADAQLSLDASLWLNRWMSRPRNSRPEGEGLSSVGGSKPG